MMSRIRCRGVLQPALALLLVARPAAAAEVKLSNLRLPVDTSGAPLLTGEIKALNNLERDGFYYFYISNWGCCEQVNCCASDAPWPEGECWQCCAAQLQSKCTYARNHTINAYRTADFGRWEDLGVLVGLKDRIPGTVFAPTVVYNARDRRYLMWYENYNATGGTPPGAGLYSIAASARASGPFKVIEDAATFNCSGSQGDFDLFVDDDGATYIIVTFYTHFCIERLDGGATRGTGATAVIPAIPRGPPYPQGDESPVMFRRGDTYHVTYATGCCGCKGGSVIWAYTAAHPLGPWTRQGMLTPHGPVTRAQQRSVFTVPDGKGGESFVHLGNNWVPGEGGPGTCTNGGLFYWWPLQFDAAGKIEEIHWSDAVSFELAAPSAAAGEAEGYAGEVR